MGQRGMNWWEDSRQMEAIQINRTQRTIQGHRSEM